MLKKHIEKKRLVFAFVMVALLAALAPATAQASGLSAGTPELAGSGGELSTQVVKKTLKPIYSYDSVADQMSKSTLVKKTGTYSLTLKNGQGIIRFKAPKTKTYSFTFSKLRSSQTSNP